MSRSCRCRRQATFTSGGRRVADGLPSFLDRLLGLPHGAAFSPSKRLFACSHRRPAACLVAAALLSAALPAAAQNALSSASLNNSCTDDVQMLTFGYYSDFRPVSYAENAIPAGQACYVHKGYEADLLTAVEAIADAGLSFRRRDVGVWEGDWLGVSGGVWQRSATQYDVVGGGITIRADREKNAAGETIVRFTSGHVAFQQSLLVRAEDAARLASYADLTSDVRVGAVAGTTGEERLLQLTGLTNADGVLAAGVRVETPQGEVVADGGPGYRITAAGESANLVGRQRLQPPNSNLPQVVYLPGETELLPALGAGEIDAVARGGIGNSDASVDSGGAFVISALDSAVEYGGFTVAADREALRSCLNEKISWLTDERRIGYAQWREDPGLFLRWASTWNRLQNGLQQDANGVLTIDLASVAPGAMSFAAASGNPNLAAVSVAGGVLTVRPNEDGEDGVAAVTVTLTESDGSVTTLRFEVVVKSDPLAPAYFRGWRLSLLTDA